MSGTNGPASPPVAWEAWRQQQLKDARNYERTSTALKCNERPHNVTQLGVE